MSPNLKKLRNALEYRCDGSDDYVRVIRRIARTRDTDAIRILARLLDSSGPIAREAMTALVSFGDAVVPAMQRCLESHDGEMRRHGELVLVRVAARAERQQRAALTQAAA